MSTLNFLVETVLGIYILILLLRVWMQYTRADFYNPASQFVVKVTQPIVGPVRRLVPAFRSIDTATLLIALILSLIKIPLMFFINYGNISFSTIFVILGIASLIKSFGELIYWLIIIRVILSWISQGRNPVDYLLLQLTEPLLAPIRRFIPAMAGLDFSPVVIFLILTALNFLGGDILGSIWNAL